MHPQDTADWALFATAFEPLQGVPGTPYVGLDLQTGAVSTLLTQDETGIYVVSPSTSPDGRYHLVQSIAPAYGRLWLLDAAMNGSSLVAESGGNAVGMISPDGCYLAMSTFAALGEGRQGQVEVRDLRSGEVRATIPDAVLLGWVRT
jgi:Tol biopolymer transport system component